MARFLPYTFELTAALEGFSMATFDFEVTLVSGQGGMDLDSSYGSDPYEAFEYYFCNQGGTEILYALSPCLKDGVSSLPKDSSLIGLSWDSDAGEFEGAEPNYEIQSVSGDEDSGWDYNFYFLSVFAARTSAATLEEAIEKVRTEALECLEIYDGVSNQVLEIEDVRVIHQAN
jgi:hypothetical protein